MTSSIHQYERAKQVLPGGVNSSTRMNKALGRPFYASHGNGSRIWDLEGREFIDMSCAHGAGLLGSAHPAMNEALGLAAELGFVGAVETPHHERLARLVCQYIPCADRVRFCRRVPKPRYTSFEPVERSRGETRSSVPKGISTAITS